MSSKELGGTLEVESELVPRSVWGVGTAGAESPSRSLGSIYLENDCSPECSPNSCASYICNVAEPSPPG